MCEDLKKKNVFLFCFFGFEVFVEFDCRSIGKRIKSALMWMVSTAVVCALVLGILYGMDHMNFLFDFELCIAHFSLTISVLVEVCF